MYWKPIQLHIHCLERIETTSTAVIIIGIRCRDSILDFRRLYTSVMFVHTLYAGWSRSSLIVKWRDQTEWSSFNALNVGFSLPRAIGWQKCAFSQLFYQFQHIRRDQKRKYLRRSQTLVITTNIVCTATDVCGSCRNNPYSNIFNPWL